MELTTEIISDSMEIGERNGHLLTPATKIGLWMTERGWYGQMRPKVNHLGLDGRKWAWKGVGQRLSNRLVEGTVKFGGRSVMVWGCMLWHLPGYACKIDGRMDRGGGDLSIQSLNDELQESFAHYSKYLQGIIFQTLNIPAKRPRNGSKIMDSFFYHGLHSLQILIQLNISGITSKEVGKV